jgi:hypothetical protein
MRAAQRFSLRSGKACFSLKTQVLALDRPHPAQTRLYAAFSRRCFLAAWLRVQIAPDGNRGLLAILFLPATAHIVGT